MKFKIITLLIILCITLLTMLKVHAEGMVQINGSTYITKNITRVHRVTKFNKPCLEIELIIGSYTQCYNSSYDREKAYATIIQQIKNSK